MEIERVVAEMERVEGAAPGLARCMTAAEGYALAMYHAKRCVVNLGARQDLDCFRPPVLTGKEQG